MKSCKNGKDMKVYKMAHSNQFSNNSNNLKLRQKVIPRIVCIHKDIQLRRIYMVLVFIMKINNICKILLYMIIKKKNKTNNNNHIIFQNNN